ncbi:MAG: type II secretion system F family protein [Bacillota bacterium]|uniref:Type II secretion system F family protein n=1 Tax=Thermanaerosceptrum fracticalcis TaxID=1712410 RepID=A0A7G6E4B5_THEFR|nr:type II secretion system F family protein [Thermanaerosceptrum fracticalcis]QNB46919.1 type II secretion system F family protein [Thermanaerosceptrum fracticalcis]
MLPVLIITFLFACTLVIAFFQSLFREQDELARRLKKFTASQVRQKQQEEDELSKPFSERVIWPFIGWFSTLVTRFTPGHSREKLQQALQFAGNPGNLKASEYQALHFLLIAVLLLLGWGLAWVTRKGFLEQVAMAFLLGLIGYLLGKVYLSTRTRQRQMAMQKELPDVLDLLTVSVEAGLGFDAAILRVVEKSKGVLAKEFVTTLQELQMGKSRREALRDLGKRTGVDDILTFVGAMIQADQLGVSITKILRTQADQVRIKRRQRVEEKAMKAPIKMLIPLVFFIFPSIFIVLLGPAAIQIYKQFLGGR